METIRYPVAEADLGPSIHRPMMAINAGLCARGNHTPTMASPRIWFSSVRMPMTSTICAPPRVQTRRQTLA